MISVPFGKEFREKYFSKFDPNVVPVNHGSFGQTPDLIFDKYVEVLNKDYAHTDRFLRFEIYDAYVDAVKALGSFVNADYHNLAIVENATIGVNIILRSYPFEKGDKIAIPSTVYGACGNTAKFLEKRYGIETVVVPLMYPMSDDEVVAKFKETFEKHHPKLALFDTVSSHPGVAVPYKSLTKLCKEHNVLSLVDGAHSVGLIPIDLEELKPDFYVSNLHKWCYVPRACAVLYIDPKHHNKIHTIPISHSYVDDDVELNKADQENLLIDKFVFVGSNNCAPVFSIIDALNFRKNQCGGEDNIRHYCFTLAKQAGELISEKWNTSILENESETLTSAMVTVEVPLEKLGITFEEFRDDFDGITQESSRIMVYEYNTLVPFAIHNDKVYARFSAQIYNDLSDYDYASEKFIDALKCLINRESDSVMKMVPRLAKIDVK